MHTIGKKERIPVTHMYNKIIIHHSASLFPLPCYVAIITDQTKFARQLKLTFDQRASVRISLSHLSFVNLYTSSHRKEKNKRFFSAIGEEKTSWQ